MLLNQTGKTLQFPEKSKYVSQNGSILFLFLISFLFSFSFSGWAIYNLKTNQGGTPQNAQSKHWLLVSQGCHSCSLVLTELTTFCSNKKPSPSKIGFFATGKDSSALLKKLKDFKADYEIFSGSPNEFYQNYKLMGTPSLKVKNKSKIVVGKEKIIKFLKKILIFVLLDFSLLQQLTTHV